MVIHDDWMICRKPSFDEHIDVKKNEICRKTIDGNNHWYHIHANIS